MISNTVECLFLSQESKYRYLLYLGLLIQHRLQKYHSTSYFSSKKENNHNILDAQMLYFDASEKYCILPYKIDIGTCIKTAYMLKKICLIDI